MKALLSLTLLAALGSAAFAQSLIVPGALTATDPTFTRPSSLITTATTAAYDTYAFNVSATGTYVGELSSPGSLDGFLFIYADAFNPAAPLTNLINGDDDYAGAFTVLPGSSQFGFNGSRIAVGGAENFAPGGLVLTAGTTYFAVVSAFNNTTAGNGLGSYTLGIGGGPGTVSLANPVPEPATMAALGFGTLAMLRRRKR